MLALSTKACSCHPSPEEVKKRGRGRAGSLTFSHAAYEQHREEVHKGDQRRHPRAGKDPHPLRRPSAPAGKAPGQQDSQRLPSSVSTCGCTNAKGRAFRERKEGSRHRRGRGAAQQSPERQRGLQKAIAVHDCGEARQPFALMPPRTQVQLHGQGDWWGHEASLLQPPCLSS